MKHDTVDNIMAWEGGSMSAEDEAKFFQELIDDGTVNSLQGMYGRNAAALIAAGVCKPSKYFNPRGRGMR